MTSDKTKKGLTEIDQVVEKSDSSSFARLMDLKIIKAERGYALARLKISGEKHLNFNGTTHGAVIFAVADHACGVCGNSLGRKAVLLHSNIVYFANPELGSVIEAEARMTHEDEISGSMVIDVKASNGKPLARNQSIIYFSKS
ncbi:MAG: PaaI family thioesterase [Pseudomonadota bacterium]